MPPTVSVTISIDPATDLVMVDRELSVGHLRHVALLAGNASIEIGSHGHVADVDLVGFIDRLQVALSELRFDAVKRMTDHQDVEIVDELARGDHFRGMPPLAHDAELHSGMLRTVGHVLGCPACERTRMATRDDTAWDATPFGRPIGDEDLTQPHPTTYPAG
jgi:hypothetical protein